MACEPDTRQIPHQRLKTAAGIALLLSAVGLLVCIVALRCHGLADNTATVGQTPVQTDMAVQAGVVRLDGADTNSSAASCPIQVLASCGRLEYQRGANTETWKTETSQDGTELACNVLLELQEQGCQLVQYGYLDVSGLAWGCLVSCPDGSALSVTLIPQQLGQPAGDNNPLQVTALRFLVPEAK